MSEGTGLSTKEDSPSNPILTVLIQTFQGDIVEQCKSVREIINHETPEVKILALELALGRFNIVMRIGGEKLESLLKAWKIIQTLPFIQNIASFATYATEIVPSEVDGYEVTVDAKTEILGYLIKMQKNIRQDVDDIQNKLIELLSLAQKEVKTGSKQITSNEVRIVEKELDRQEDERRFRRKMRIFAAIFGGGLLVSNIVFVGFSLLSQTTSLNTQFLGYMLGLALVGGILVLIAVAYERVSAYIGAKFGKD